MWEKYIKMESVLYAVIAYSAYLLSDCTKEEHGEYQYFVLC